MDRHIWVAQVGNSMVWAGITFLTAATLSCSQTSTEQAKKPSSPSSKIERVSSKARCHKEVCKDAEDGDETDDKKSDSSNASSPSDSETPRNVIHASSPAASQSPSLLPAAPQDPSPSSSPPAGPRSTAAQLQSGEAIYLANCGTGGICHTAAKNGPGNVIDNRSDQALSIAVNAVSSRGGEVIKLTPEQIQDLGAYLRAP